MILLGQDEVIPEVDTRIHKLRERLGRLTIVGSPGVLVHGGWDTGYAVNIQKNPDGACCDEFGNCTITKESQCSGFWLANSGCDPNPCVEQIVGACCRDDGTCFVTSETFCNDSGGTYQGDGTDCDPNPCPQPPTGACCVGSDCSIETEADCIGMGGIYQGDSTPCTPNPCTGDCVCGGFLNPDDGLYYNTKIYTNTIDNTHCPPGGTCLCFSGPNPDPEVYPCGSNRWMFEGDNPDSLLVSEHFNEACEIVQTFSNFDVGYYCCCFSSCDDPTTCAPYIPGTCPPCEGAPIPEIWTKCGIVTTTISYADPCNP